MIERHDGRSTRDDARRQGRSIFVWSPSARGAGRRPRPGRGGFTLIELMLGVLVTSMTLAAVAALAMAVSDSWQGSASPQSARVGAMQGSVRLVDLVTRSKYLGYAGRRADGSGASVLLWAKDETNVGWMELSEVVLVEFEAGSKTVTLYQVPAGAPNAAMLCDRGDIDEAADVTAFKQSASLAQVALHDVVDFTPAAIVGKDDSGRPGLEYTLRVQDGQDESWSYQTAALRAPAPAPAKCRDGACQCEKVCTCASAKSCGCGPGAACKTSGSAACRHVVAGVTAPATSTP